MFDPNELDESDLTSLTGHEFFEEDEYTDAQRLLDELLFGSPESSGGFNGDTDFFNRYEDESD